jgi:predicted ATPase
MYTTLAVSGYRSLRDVVLPLAPLTVVTRANGAGKSSLYRALRLLGACAQGRVVGALAHEGGLESAMWAGPESLAQARRGHPVQGTTRRGPVSLRLGVGGEELSYLVDLGIPVQSAATAFNRDPEVKREAVWTGPVMRPGTLVARRDRRQVELRDDDGRWRPAPLGLPPWAGMLSELVDPAAAPELWAVREQLRSWRFYDGFRVDREAATRRPQVATRTWALADDGSDLGSALQTVREDTPEAPDEAVADAFDGARLSLPVQDGLIDVGLQQPGMLRPLRSAELSDGTLRYLLWLAALMTPVPPALMALNEPETSLHPTLVPALGRLVAATARRTQVVVVTHSGTLVDALTAAAGRDDPPGTGLVELVKDLGESVVSGQGLLTTPAWEWGRR